MTDLNPAVLVLTGAIFALTILTFLYLLWKREWSWLGLYVALGGLFYVPAYGAIPVLMALEPSYAEKPLRLAAFAWPFGLGWGLLAAAVSALQATAMIAALRRPTPRSSAAIIVCSAYNLLATALGFFEQWVASGNLPTLGVEGGQLSVWVGFPIIFLLTICPYLFAIPWGFLRLTEAASGTARAILSRYWQMMGTVLVLLAVIGAAIGLGIAKGTWLGSDRDARALLLVAGALGLTWLVLIFTMFSFRRAFLVPAISILEGVRTGQPLAAAADVGPVWQPLAQSIEDSHRRIAESQAQLTAFLDNLPLAMNFINADGKVVMINRFAASYYDCTPEELQGKDVSFFSSYYPDAANAGGPVVYDPLTTGETTTVETEWHGQNGNVRQFRITSFPVPGANGQAEFVGMFFVDVTEERRARAEVFESRATLNAFFNHVPAAMYLKNLDNEYVLINELLASQYRLTPGDMIGHQELGFLEPALQERIRKFDAHILATKEPVFGEFRFSVHDGFRDGLTARFPILNPAGEITHIGGIIFDVTAQREAEGEVARAQKSLHQSEKLAALGSMLAGVSHELNNPLAAVIGQAALLAEDLEGTPHAERVSKIRRAADRCARIVQSFLAMARQKAPEYRSVGINDQVRSAVELTEYQMRAAQVTLDLRLSDGLPNVEADPDELHQVIANLLTNARQALEEVSGERRITLTTSRKNDTIRLSVADTGKGIDAATRDRIFDPFFTTKAVGSGTGIGLSYSLGIIEAHGGKITIEDADVGTTFVITLPVKDDATETAAPEQADGTKAKGRALVIDDEEDVADTLSDMLHRQGLEVTVAIGGLAGQAAMEGDAHFDVILSDIRMPDQDGPALYDWMVANRPDLTGCIAFVTGDTLSGVASDFIARSGCAVLEKPFTPAALRELVAAMLEGDQK